MHRLALTIDQRTELRRTRDHAAEPYVRERAAALLKIADGQPAAQVARTGLLRPRQPDTLYRWLERYRADGVAGLRIRPGRGRKPAFVPHCRDAAHAKATLLHLVRRDPRTLGVARSRWRLADLLAQCPWLCLHTPRGLGRLLARLAIGYKRGRDYIHSPDPNYETKWAAVEHAAAAAAAAPEQFVQLWLDELTVYRQPTVARGWEASGRAQPLARRSTRANTPTRIIGALDGRTGRLHTKRASRITLPTLVSFFRQLRAAYPTAERIDLVLDNWPIHFHPDVLAVLAPQESPWLGSGPPNWPTAPSPAAVAKWGTLKLPIQLVPLPTYASWGNAIEKVWRKLRDELGHLHPWADDLPRLRTELDTWLATYNTLSPDLLRYVGLPIHD
jgi:hypothetical protein